MQLPQPSVVEKYINQFKKAIKDGNLPAILVYILIFSGSILWVVGGFRSAILSPTSPPSTQAIATIMASGNTNIQNSIIQNLSVTQTQANSVVKNNSTSTDMKENLLQGDLTMVGLISETGEPIKPEIFALAPEPSVKGNNGLYRTTIRMVIAVAPSPRVPSLNTITPPPDVDCTPGSFVSPPVTMVSGKFVGRIAYIYKTECTAKYELTQENLPKIQIDYNY